MNKILLSRLTFGAIIKNTIDYGKEAKGISLQQALSNITKHARKEKMRETAGRQDQDEGEKLWRRFNYKFLTFAALK